MTGCLLTRWRGALPLYSAGCALWTAEQRTLAKAAKRGRSESVPSYPGLADLARSYRGLPIRPVSDFTCRRGVLRGRHQRREPSPDSGPRPLFSDHVPRGVRLDPRLAHSQTLPAHPSTPTHPSPASQSKRSASFTGFAKQKQRPLNEREFHGPYPVGPCLSNSGAMPCCGRLRGFSMVAERARQYIVISRHEAQANID
jgi:hypothetical protein